MAAQVGEPPTIAPDDALSQPSTSTAINEVAVDPEAEPEPEEESSSDSDASISWEDYERRKDILLKKLVLCEQQIARIKFTGKHVKIKQYEDRKDNIKKGVDPVYLTRVQATQKKIEVEHELERTKLLLEQAENERLRDGDLHCARTMFKDREQYSNSWEDYEGRLRLNVLLKRIWKEDEVRADLRMFVGYDVPDEWLDEFVKEYVDELERQENDPEVVKARNMAKYRKATWRNKEDYKSMQQLAEEIDIQIRGLKEEGRVYIDEFGQRVVRVEERWVFDEEEEERKEQEMYAERRKWRKEYTRKRMKNLSHKDLERFLGTGKPRKVHLLEEDQTITMEDLEREIIPTEKVLRRRREEAKERKEGWRTLKADRLEELRYEKEMEEKPQFNPELAKKDVKELTNDEMLQEQERLKLEIAKLMKQKEKIAAKNAAQSETSETAKPGKAKVKSVKNGPPVPRPSKNKANSIRPELAELDSMPGPSRVNASLPGPSGDSMPGTSKELTRTPSPFKNRASVTGTANGPSKFSGDVPSNFGDSLKQRAMTKEEIRRHNEAVLEEYKKEVAEVEEMERKHALADLKFKNNERRELIKQYDELVGQWNGEPVVKQSRPRTEITLREGVEAILKGQGKLDPPAKDDDERILRLKEILRTMLKIKAQKRNDPELHRAKLKFLKKVTEGEGLEWEPYKTLREQAMEIERERKEEKKDTMLMLKNERLIELAKSIETRTLNQPNIGPLYDLDGEAREGMYLLQKKRQQSATLNEFRKKRLDRMEKYKEEYRSSDEWTDDEKERKREKRRLEKLYDREEYSETEYDSDELHYREGRNGELWLLRSANSDKRKELEELEDESKEKNMSKDVLLRAMMEGRDPRTVNVPVELEKQREQIEKEEESSEDEYNYFTCLEKIDPVDSSEERDVKFKRVGKKWAETKPHRRWRYSSGSSEDREEEEKEARAQWNKQRPDRVPLIFQAKPPPKPQMSVQLSQDRIIQDLLRVGALRERESYGEYTERMDSEKNARLLASLPPKQWNLRLGLLSPRSRHTVKNFPYKKFDRYSNKDRKTYLDTLPEGRIDDPSISRRWEESEDEDEQLSDGWELEEEAPSTSKAPAKIPRVVQRPNTPTRNIPGVSSLPKSVLEEEELVRKLREVQRTLLTLSKRDKRKLWAPQEVRKSKRPGTSAQKDERPPVPWRGVSGRSEISTLARRPTDPGLRRGEVARPNPILGGFIEIEKPRRRRRKGKAVPVKEKRVTERPKSRKKKVPVKIAVKKRKAKKRSKSKKKEVLEKEAMQVSRTDLGPVTARRKGFMESLEKGGISFKKSEEARVIEDYEYMEVDDEEDEEEFEDEEMSDEDEDEEEMEDEEMEEMEETEEVRTDDSIEELSPPGPSNASSPLMNQSTSKKKEASGMNGFTRTGKTSVA